jgi:hypothetical protein
MKRSVTVLVISILSFFSLKGQTQAEFNNLLNQINSDSIRQTIVDLASFNNRYCDRTVNGNRQVAQYLVQRLRNYGIENARIDSFHYVGNTWLTGDLDRYFYNVVGRIPGSASTDTTYIIGAHLDAISLDDYWQHTPTAPGADDNASGCAIFIEMARIFHANNLTPRFNIDFMGWDAEEIGLIGSYSDASDRATAGEVGKTIILNNDMVANQPADSTYTVDLYRYDNSMDLYDIGTDILETYTSIVPIFPDDNTTLRQYTDSWAYNQSGFNAIFAIEHFFTDYYHTELDLPSSLNFDYAKEIAKYNFGMLYHYNIHDVFNLDTSGVGIKQPDLSNITLYPNPTIGEVNINNKNNITIHDILVFDLSGRLIEHYIPSTNENIQFNINYLNQGVYIIKINTSQGEIFRKMIKK